MRVCSDAGVEVGMPVGGVWGAGLIWRARIPNTPSSDENNGVMVKFRSLEANEWLTAGMGVLDLLWGCVLSLESWTTKRDSMVEGSESKSAMDIGQFICRCLT